MSINTTEDLNQLDLIACYFDVSHNDPATAKKADDLIDHHFNIYVSGKEFSKEKNIAHIHVCGTEKKPGKSYIAFVTAIKREWHLVGKATKGKRKQYGKVSKIKEKINMLAYTIKDGNYNYQHFTKRYITWVSEEVFYTKPDNRKNKYDNLKKLLKEKMTEYNVIEYFSWEEQQNKPTRSEYVGVILVEEYFKLFDSLPTKNIIQKLFFQIGLVTAAEYYAFTMGNFTNFKNNSTGYYN